MFLATLLTLTAAAHAVEITWVGGGHASNPQWSPDGTWLAYEVNNNADKVDLYVVRVQNGNPGQATKVVIPGSSSSFSATGGYAANPNWHPKGPVIFEAANPGGNTRLYYLSPGGSSPAEYLAIGQAPGNLAWPSVSPDGINLAYTSSASGAGDVYLFSSSTSKASLTTPSALPENAPRFSPDGKTLVFSRKSQGTEDLYTWTVGATVQSPFKGGAGDQSRPRFAGDKVVYFTNERGDDHWDIGVLPAASPGGTAAVVAKDIRLPLRSQPPITPDGSAVVWTSMAPNTDGLVYVTKLDGSGTKQVNTGLTAVGDASISTSGGRTFLAFTALPTSGSDWRQLHVVDITGQI
jgi:Tol biopolymer transport system component